MSEEQHLPDHWRLVEFAEIDSTNAEVLRRAESGEREGLAVRANGQSSGRGRRGRAWSSPEGNLYLSILIDAPAREAGQVGFAVALALVEAIEAETGQRLPDLRCKWPNDLLYDGKKVAGLLLEGVPSRDQVVAGMGVNLKPTGVADAMYPVGSLADLDIPPQTLCPGVCLALARWLDTWRTFGFAPIRRAWLERANGIGESIIVRLPRDTYKGKFEGLADDGALLLDQGTGEMKTISAGDVFFGAEV